MKVLIIKHMEKNIKFPLKENKGGKNILKVLILIKNANGKGVKILKMLTFQIQIQKKKIIL